MDIRTRKARTRTIHGPWTDDQECVVWNLRAEFPSFRITCEVVGDGGTLWQAEHRVTGEEFTASSASALKQAMTTHQRAGR